MSDSDLTIGATYQHYKGAKYKVHGTAFHSEGLEEVVIYEALYKNKLSQMWVRPKKMFLETIEFEGKKRPRFIKVED